MNILALLERLPARRRTPLSTYRLQLHHQFGFREAAAVLPYLERLGVSDCYTSSVFKARPGSLHGYDITDHNALNPELGSEADYERFARISNDAAWAICWILCLIIWGLIPIITRGGAMCWRMARRLRLLRTSISIGLRSSRN